MGQALTAQTYFDEESGEMMLDLPEEVITELGLEVNDLLQWSVDEDGRVVVTKFVEELDEADDMVTPVTTSKLDTDK